MTGPSEEPDKEPEPVLEKSCHQHASQNEDRQSLGPHGLYIEILAFGLLEVEDSFGALRD